MYRWWRRCKRYYPHGGWVTLYCDKRLNVSITTMSSQSQASTGKDLFIAKDNICGQTLLRLSARGSSLIAELFRLSANIPAAFLPNPDGSPNQSVESQLLFDFSYIKKPEYYERLVSAPPFPISPTRLPLLKDNL